MIAKSKVHLIEPGFQLAKQGNHVVKMNIATKQVVADFGEVTNQPLGIKSSGHSVASAPIASNPGWVTYAAWEQPSSQNIGYIQTSWTVPAAPMTNDNQLLYIFNGLENSTQSDIMQPVLQWGVSPAGGGQFWAIANWYVWSGGAGYSPLISVSSGATLQGLITLNGQNADGSYNFTSSFAGYSNSLPISEGDVSNNGASIPAVPGQLWAVETLETYNNEGVNDGYNVVQATDYPAGLNYIEMNTIEVTVGGTVQSFSWNTYPITSGVDGEHTVQVVEDAYTSFNTVQYGDLRIYWHPGPTVGGEASNEGYSTYAFSNTTAESTTITGFPGSTVNVDLIARVVGRGTNTAVFTITTPGVTFTDGATTASVTVQGTRVGGLPTSGNLIKGMVMPTSGSVTLSDYITNGGTGGVLSNIGTIIVY
jgi:hypothetical protein